MKRINIPFIVIVVTLFVACSKPSLEDRARDRIKTYTKIFVNDPNSLIIQDVKSVLSNDSLCILQFLSKSKNRFGGYETYRMEYYIVRETNPKEDGTFDWYECLYPLDGHEPLLKVTSEMEEEMEYKMNKEGFEYDKNIERSAFYNAHTLNLWLDSYRKVEE